MIELPFELEFDVYLDSEENLSLWCEKFLNEISEFSPLPKLNFYINEDFYNFYADEVQNYKKTYPDSELYLIFSKYRKVDELPQDFHFIIDTSADENLYNLILQLSNAGANRIILQHSCDNTDENLYENLKKELKKISENPPPGEIFLLPYLEEKEMQNYYQKKRENRAFLTCAQPWLNPIIKGNGDLFCCKNKTVGNLQNDSFLNLWRTTIANETRKEIFDKKRFADCNNCRYFYKKAFLAVENGVLEYKGQRFIFESELNYLESAPILTLCEDPKADNKKHLIPIPAFSSEQLHDIRNNYKIFFILKN